MAPCRAAVVLLNLILLGSCGALPQDSAGSLERIRQGELRAGAAVHPPWVSAAGDAVDGVEPALLAAWARQLGARVVWRIGAEAELVEALHRRELDVVVAGFASSTPYMSRMAITQPYADVEDRYGSTKHRVLAVMPGESAMLFSLDRFLASQDRGAVLRLIEHHRTRVAER